MNKVFLIGNLTRDPELSETPSGVAVCHFSIAVNRNYSSGDGERQTDFFNCVAWRGLGETIARCGYKSFYDMVSFYRVKYAVDLIKDDPQLKMADVACRSGFASATSMNKAFASQGLQAPTFHRAPSSGENV